MDLNNVMLGDVSFFTSLKTHTHTCMSLGNLQLVKFSSLHFGVLRGFGIGHRAEFAPELELLL